MTTHPCAPLGPFSDNSGRAQLTRIDVTMNLTDGKLSPMCEQTPLPHHGSIPDTTAPGRADPQTLSWASQMAK